jgi:uncharacterized membrane protein YcaP (DUF421 family)
MEPHNVIMILDFVSLVAVVSLFIYIKWYFSTLSSNVRNRLRTHEIVLSIFMAMVVLYVISNRDMPLIDRAVFFIVTVAIHIGTCLVVLKQLKRKPLIYPKSYLVFHNGKFLKGAILQNKISEDDILQTLKLKGVDDLKEVDTIILEADGELSVIFKEKVNIPAN